MSAIFDRSAPDLRACPDESLPEFAFIGRSNVGKSSLLNMLTGQRNLARVSQTPGCTKLINFFTINGRWRMVDLPGYGFAQVAKADRSQFNRAVGEYLKHRRNLHGVLTLVDAMLPPQKIDLEFMGWLAVHSIPFVLVFTKIDRQSAARSGTNIASFLAELDGICEGKPDTFQTSAKTGAGRSELLAAIEAALPPDTGREAAGTRSAPQADATGRGVTIRRPNPARPW